MRYSSNKASVKSDKAVILSFRRMARKSHFTHDFKDISLGLDHMDFGLSRVTLPEKAMATHSGTLAWKVPWAEEPGRLQSMGSGRVGHD